MTETPRGDSPQDIHYEMPITVGAIQSAPVCARAEGGESTHRVDRVTCPACNQVIDAFPMVMELAAEHHQERAESLRLQGQDQESRREHAAARQILERVRAEASAA